MTSKNQLADRQRAKASKLSFDYTMIFLGPLDAFASAAQPCPLTRQEAIRRILRERLTGLIV
jgi:hypothetical protein